MIPRVFYNKNLEYLQDKVEKIFLEEKLADVGDDTHISERVNRRMGENFYEYVKREMRNIPFRFVVDDEEFNSFIRRKAKDERNFRRTLRKVGGFRRVGVHMRTKEGEDIFMVIRKSAESRPQVISIIKDSIGVADIARSRLKKIVERF